MKYLVPPREGDVEFVAEHMRTADVRECEAMGFSPLAALSDSVAFSDVVYTMLTPEGDPAGLLGVSRGLLPEWGSIWLLGTPAIEQFSMTFLRRSLPELKRLFKETGKDLLYNYTHAENELHHKWLKWLGFKFIRRTRVGPLNEEFIEFARLRG